MKSVIVTRDELYRQVWETPMMKLAAQYGLSGNGLAKICDRLTIPYPPRGYWARKAAGQNVDSISLPPPEEGIPVQVTITSIAPKIDIVPPSAEFLDRAARLHNEVAFSGSPVRRRSHPIVQNWVREREEAITDYRRNKPVFGTKPQPFTDIDKRMHEVLRRLLWSLEKAGGKVADKLGGNIECIMDGEPILFQVREKLRQLRLQPPPGKAPGSSFYPRTELRPTGYLVLSVKTRLPGGLRHEWIEKGEKRLEDFVPEIVAVMMAAGPLLVEERRQREEEARLWRAEEQRRYEEQQRRKTDRNRWRRFLEHASRHQEAELARSFLAALGSESVESELNVDGRPIAEWIEWAKEWIEAHDTAKRGPKWLFEDISSVSNWSYQHD